METTSNTPLRKGIAIQNAGLILLNTYFNLLFDRLELIKENAFISKNTQVDAAHYLQFIATGLTHTKESLLVLNKVLVGLPPNEPISDGVEMDTNQKELINGMISSAIAYWSSIGNSSIEGFRGNWLVRDGILREMEDRWELVVEKRSYDILMQKSPFSFSIINLPWMSKPLHVQWPY